MRSFLVLAYGASYLRVVGIIDTSHMLCAQQHRRSYEGAAYKSVVERQFETCIGQRVSRLLIFMSGRATQFSRHRDSFWRAEAPEWPRVPPS
jgi:hypothetical protein